jgi:hypothetical protein
MIVAPLVEEVTLGVWVTVNEPIWPRRTAGRWARFSIVDVFSLGG